ncbi:Alkaline ceramidase 3 [Allomyces arbusculus]|nr:Alkaline ceramidase 3 [Allomyces arbusculus]
MHALSTPGSAAAPPWTTDALVDWCEGNFEVLSYVAEFCNTFSNVIQLSLAVAAMTMAYKFQYGARFVAAFAGIAIVAIGSCLFHGTLTYHMQLLDEVPMLLASGIATYCCITPHRAKPPTWATILSLGLPFLVTAIYLSNRIPEFFQVAHGIQLLAVIALNISNWRVAASPARALFVRALFAYAGAFALWNADTLLCRHLSPIKHALGWPFRGVLELHAWWHVLAGYACYLGVMYAAAVRFGARGVHVDVRVWRGVVPYVVPRVDEKRDVDEAVDVSAAAVAAPREKRTGDVHAPAVAVAAKSTGVCPASGAAVVEGTPAMARVRRISMRATTTAEKHACPAYVWVKE